MTRFSVLIDGNNMAWRQIHTHQGLSFNDKPTGMIYGFIKNLLRLKDIFDVDLSHFAVIWDDKSERRLKESALGVEKGIIPSDYKSGRKEMDEQQKLLRCEFYNQLPDLRSVLTNTCCQQIMAKGYEADDVIAAYTSDTNLRPLIIVSTDHDFFQLLRDDVYVYNPIKDKSIDQDDFTSRYKVNPDQWIDIGALMGDSSDTIHGVPGIGEVTATKLIYKHGTVQNVIDFCKKKLKRSKIEQKIIDFEKRIHLAYSLKKMDFDFEVPELKKRSGNMEKLTILFQSFGFDSLYNKEKEFCCE